MRIDVGFRLFFVKEGGTGDLSGDLNWGFNMGMWD